MPSETGGRAVKMSRDEKLVFLFLLCFSFDIKLFAANSRFSIRDDALSLSTAKRLHSCGNGSKGFDSIFSILI